MTTSDTEEMVEGGQSPIRRFPEGVALTAASLFGAAIVLAGLILGGPVIEGLSSPSTTTTTVTTAPRGGTAPFDAVPADPLDPDDAPPPTAPPTPEVDPAECPPDVVPDICELAAFVQTTRGRTFERFPEVELLEPEAFRAEVAAVFNPAGPRTEATGTLLRSLGMVEPDVVLVDELRTLLDIGVVGFYQSGSERLVVRSDGELDLFAKQVVVHELTHALDDQWFDIGRSFDDRDTDYAFDAVVEGNARRVEDLWIDGLDAEQRRALTEATDAVLTDQERAVVDAAPDVIRRLLRSPYEDGAVYVGGVAAEGGEAAVDELFDVPPTTSEEILHPRTDRALDPVREVPVPPADGEPLADGRVGELLIRQWLGRVAGDGWGGDRYVRWEAGGRTCVRVDVATDTDDDRTDVLAAGAAWAQSAPGARTVEPINTESGPLVRLTGCV